ncbi:MAG: 23S rRNA (adenine(2503)-C(2))-methyltransferase RlmN [Candidatus Omnitrophica bacterium]|nr:23S rRNA (adenine(2503)-C(2))-methyltransferase RlmN [Candidatus Omnitrophota bacterium]MBD3269380.1 23S rRNA (adenine(2503)-C(2))-methyltransferase RlmN [Candidatus Omnitrophota bacterium]
MWPMEKVCIYHLTLDELKNKLISEDFPAYRAQQVFDWIYRKGVSDFSFMSNISKREREKLSGIFEFINFEIMSKRKSADGTEKFLFKLRDDLSIETVVIPEKRRNTLCLSTQVGCKFNCRFCVSARGGFIRNLETSEIIKQYLDVSRAAEITNIVFMGIGEPLDNFSNLVKSIRILKAKEGAGMPARRLTVSTCGLPKAIKKLAGLKLGVKLSVSLHSAYDEKRDKIMPVNRRYPLGVLLDSLKEFSKVSRYPVTFEYVMIKGFNVSLEDARRLAKFCNSLKSKVNLIPLNLSRGGLDKPDEPDISKFRDKLKRHGCLAVLRKPRGEDIEAACGQLRASLGAKKPF